MRRPGGFALVPFLILVAICAIGGVDIAHGSLHGKNKTPREYSDPHKHEPPYEATP